MQNVTSTRLEGARGPHTARTLHSRVDRRYSSSRPTRVCATSLLDMPVSLSASRRWPPRLRKAAADKGEERATLDSKTDPPARARARRTPRRASGPRAGPHRLRARVVAILRRDVARASSRVEVRWRPEMLAPPVHQQLAGWRGVAEANEAAAQLHLARIREPIGAKTFRSKTVSTPSSSSARSGL